jgi:hypothetical protein
MLVENVDDKMVTNKNEVGKDIVEKLVASLFNQHPTILFKKNTPSLINKFAHHDDVYLVTAEYIKKLIAIWENNYPEKKLDIYDHSIIPQQHQSTLSFTPAAIPNSTEQQTIIDESDRQQKMANDFKETQIVQLNNGFSSNIDKEMNSSQENKRADLDVIVECDQGYKKEELVFETGQASLNNNLNHELTDKLVINNAIIDNEEIVVGALPLKNQEITSPLITGKNSGKVSTLTSVNLTPRLPSGFFSIANAKCGEIYKKRILGKDSNNKELRIIDVKIPEGLGLSFNAETEELYGTPMINGDHKLILQWAEKLSVGRYTGECLLTVIPDAKNLWKNIDPPENDPYFKSNEEHKLIRTANFKIAGASSRGRSHAHTGIFRDDDFFIFHDPESEWSILIVADGAGGSKNSRWGSKLAVEAAGAHLVRNLSSDMGKKMNLTLSSWNEETAKVSKEMYTRFYFIFQEASASAVKAIESEAAIKGIPPKDYSTTLLAAAIKRMGNKTFLSTFWMGDGAIAAYGPRGKIRLMGTPDSGEYAGQTRFLDQAALRDHGFSKRVGIGLYEDITAVLLMTDGISDPRFETDNNLKDSAKWDALWDEISPYISGNNPDLDLLKWLDFLTPGHHDDRTIALLW